MNKTQHLFEIFFANVKVFYIPFDQFHSFISFILAKQKYSFISQTFECVFLLKKETECV